MNNIKFKVCLFLILLLAGCQHSTSSLNDPAPVVNLDMSDFEPASEDKSYSPELIDVPEVKLQEGQLKPLPKQIRIDSGKDITEKTATTDEKKQPEIISKPYPIPIPSTKDRSLLTDKDKEIIKAMAKNVVSQASAVEDAMRKSQVRPSALPENWINAITIYDYMDGALFQIYLTPNRTTDLILAPGEKIISKSAGDTLRWLVGETEHGSGHTLRKHVMIKPKYPDIESNLTITTNQRTYYLELHSTSNKSYMAAVQWNYPTLDFIDKSEVISESNEAEQQKSLQLSNLENLNFNYVFKSYEDGIEWFPLRAFDNGEKTYIQFPPDMQYRQAPVLYVLSNDREEKPQLVNYRVSDGFYVVDRIFQAAVLMEGNDYQRKVTILNNKLYKEKQSLFASTREEK